MNKNSDKIIKAQIIAWVIFAITTIFILYNLYNVIQILNVQGETPNLILFLTPSISIILWFFSTRYIVERQKAKMYRQELERLQKLTGKKYPERLENLPKKT